MENKSHPVFRDFLGTGSSSEARQPEHSVTDSVRASSGGFAENEDGEGSIKGGSLHSAHGPLSTGCLTPPILSDPNCDMLRHARNGLQQSYGHKGAIYSHEEFGRKRDISVNRDSLKESLQMSIETLENSRPPKVSRFKQTDENKRLCNDVTTNSAELRLSMQPPRPSSTGSLWLQTSVFKTDLSTGSSKRVECSKPVLLTPGPRLGPTNSAEKSFQKDNANGANMLVNPPADEGSRTGLKGSGLAGLLNNCSPSKMHTGTTGENNAPSRLLPSQTSSHQPSAPTVPATRQLTIFYSGQAHVFDDVPPDKADAIMALAGSNGRSWSTTYAHRSSANTISSSANETSIPDIERQREKSASCGASMNGLGRLALASEVQSLLQGLAQTGVHSGQHCAGMESRSTKISAEMQQPSSEMVAVGGNQSINGNARFPGRPSTYHNTNEGGQHWS